MAKFAPNLYHQFLELPPRERFSAVAALGFDAVEWHFPYEIPKEELRNLLLDNGLTLVNAVTPVDWTKDKGLAGQPGREDEFKRAATVALEYATLCGWKTLHPGPGTVPKGLNKESCIATFERNLDWLCRQAKQGGPQIVIEGVCNARFPNYVIQTMDDALEVVKEINLPNLGVVYDTFHLRMEHSGSLVEIYDRSFPYVKHIQIGNAPLRLEPGVGELDLHYIINHIDKSGWDSWIGLEFDPSIDSWTSLMWANDYGYKVTANPHAAHGKIAPRAV